MNPEDQKTPIDSALIVARKNNLGLYFDAFKTEPAMQKLSQILESYCLSLEEAEKEDGHD